MELVYPKKFEAQATHGQKAKLGRVLAEAEATFRDISKKIIDPLPPSWDPEGPRWEDPAYRWVRTIVLGFGEIYPVLSQIEKFIPNACEYVFDQLPKHPDPKELEDFEHYRRKDFIKTAEAHVRNSEGWLQLLQDMGHARRFSDGDQHSQDEAVSSERILKKWLDEVEKQTGHRPSQRDLYDKAGVSRSSFNNWLKGKDGSMVRHEIEKAMAGKWIWDTMNQRFTLTAQVLLLILPIS